MQIHDMRYFVVKTSDNASCYQDITTISADENTHSSPIPSSGHNDILSGNNSIHWPAGCRRSAAQIRTCCTVNAFFREWDASPNTEHCWAHSSSTTCLWGQNTHTHTHQILLTDSTAHLHVTVCQDMTPILTAWYLFKRSWILLYLPALKHFKAQPLLYAPPAVFVWHVALLHSLWLSEWTGIISPYSISRLVFLNDRQCNLYSLKLYIVNIFGWNKCSEHTPAIFSSGYIL